MTHPLLTVRVDATASMGTGHAMRCLSLARAHGERGGRCCFLMVEGHEGMSSRIAAANVELRRLECVPGSMSDADVTAESAKGLGAEWIVVDGYQFGAQYERHLRTAGLRVLALDDYGERGDHDADILLDQNLDARAMHYPRATADTFLLGTEYVLLRPEFRALERARPMPDRAHGVLVTMGGGDAPNVSERVLQVLLASVASFEQLRVVIVAGALNPNVASLQAVARTNSASVELRTDVTDMAELMMAADIAISAGGSTSWELCATGAPQVVLSLAQNQRPLAEALAAHGLAVDLGWAEACSDAALTSTIQSLAGDARRRSEMSRRGRELVDGKGVWRVLDALGR